MISQPGSCDQRTRWKTALQRTSIFFFNLYSWRMYCSPRTQIILSIVQRNTGVYSRYFIVCRINMWHDFSDDQNKKFARSKGRLRQCRDISASCKSIVNDAELVRVSVDLTLTSCRTVFATVACWHDLFKDHYRVVGWGGRGGGVMWNYFYKALISMQHLPHFIYTANDDGPS